MTKTPWFPMSVNPVREGYYEVKFTPRDVTRLWWRKDGWSLDEHDWGSFIVLSFDKWRGLAEPPK